MFARIALAAFALMAPLTAHAHSGLERASPAPGSTVRIPPSEVELSFTENLEPAFSTVAVRNAAGTRVDDAKARVDPNARNVLRVSLKPLAPGTYQVNWRVLSVDTHRTQGSFSFTVRP
jgi:copper resistance protein C